MIRIKFDANLIKTMTFFEAVTHAKLKDCVDEGEKMVFIVEPGQLFKALGKNTANLKKLEVKFNKKIRIIEFHSEKLTFIGKAIAPLRVDDMEDNDDGIVTLKSSDMKVKGLLIGRAARNLRNLEAVVQRYFPEVKEIKVA